MARDGEREREKLICLSTATVASPLNSEGKTLTCSPRCVGQSCLLYCSTTTTTTAPLPLCPLCPLARSGTTAAIAANHRSTRVPRAKN